MRDIFGRILMDAARGEDAPHLVERDDGKVEEHLGSRYIDQFEVWRDSEKEAIQDVKGRVLDIGCGAGRVASYLIEKGFEVVGIDISKGAIEACRYRGIDNVFLMSAESLDFPKEHFDTVLLFGANFGILGEEDRIIRMLKEIHRVTTPDAIILASTRDVTITSDPLHLAYHEKNRKRGLPIGKIRIRISYQGEAGEWWWLRHASPEEMALMAEASGWKLEKIYEPRQFYVGRLSKE